ncbi:hypothetical protein EUX98_g5123 [Antrodiella citrinella]|uniref:UNC-45/Cro1/She4 central domain-containing protein n=1 Tax=Antrodiella citrinella TaxID=2447956 RepID=A0A4S4MTA0_9APHY|nr:hypothetical protein EUX98_g5123 [Antrodiella citrinella]
MSDAQPVVKAVAVDEETNLDTILKKSQDKSWSILFPDEIQLLLTAFLPSQPLAFRSKAYIVLSAFSQRLRELAPKAKLSNRQDGPDVSTQSIVNALSPSLISKLGDTTEPDILAGLTFLVALFQTDWQAASAILLQDGVYDTLEDIPDLLPASASVSLALAHLIAQAAGHKSCRTVISSQTVQWLEEKARQKDDTSLRAAAAVALVKLNKGNLADAAANPLAAASPASASVGSAGGGDADLAQLMKRLVLDAPTSSPSSSIQDAVEGLAYMSADPTIKEMLSSDAKFLSRLFATVPRRKTLWSESSEDMGMTPLYGTILIISNLCAYRPRRTEEETQIAKLRKLAQAGGANSGSKVDDVTEENKLDDKDHVLARGRRLLQVGVMDALTSAVKATESRAVRLAVGKALLSLVEDNTSRGKILQSGGAKALSTIIQDMLSSAPSAAGPDKGKTPYLDASDLEPIQALAKLAITASPVQVFGPNAGALYDAIRPFTLMLTHPSATLLQQFEAIMALTNMSSTSPDAADKIAHSEGLFSKVELLMLEDHTLVRRASIELVCNLIAGSDDVFEKYGGRSGESSKRKLQVLVALCDVEDLATRLAASGAVATVSDSPVACGHLLELQKEKGRVLPILGQLIDPSILPPSDDATSGVEELEETAGGADPGLVHRGVMCVRNFLVGIKENKEGSKEVAQDAQRIGLVQALAGVFKANSSNRSSPLLRPAAEALKCLMENGIPIQT